MTRFYVDEFQFSTDFPNHKKKHSVLPEKIKELILNTFLKILLTRWSEVCPKTICKWQRRKKGVNFHTGGTNMQKKNDLLCSAPGQLSHNGIN